MPKVFIDTNILAYAMDQASPSKRERSRSLIRQVQAEQSGVVSTQVLQEFYVVATRKLKVDPILAKGVVQSFENFEVVIVTPELIREAADCSILQRLSFWDSLIVVCAQSARCERIWSEDLPTGQVVRGVRIENPLS
jgi:predicted nucleic acid-binding protein